MRAQTPPRSESEGPSGTSGPAPRDVEAWPRGGWGHSLGPTSLIQSTSSSTAFEKFNSKLFHRNLLCPKWPPRAAFRCSGSASVNTHGLYCVGMGGMPEPESQLTDSLIHVICPHLSGHPVTASGQGD